MGASMEPDLLSDAAARRALSRAARRAPRGAHADAVAALAAWDVPLPDVPRDPRRRSPRSTRSGRPPRWRWPGARFFGFVIGGALPAAVAASWLATAWDQNAGSHDVTPATARARARSRCAGWSTCSACRRDAAAAFVTGATVANFTGLAAARHARARARGLGRRGATGSSARRRSRSWSATRRTPRCSRRSACSGSAASASSRVPVDGQGRMRADALPDARRSRRSSACRRAT